MKFKNDKNAEEGNEARILSLTDSAGDKLTMRAYVDGKPQFMIDVNDGEAVGMTRAKALKLALAIISELSPTGI